MTLPDPTGWFAIGRAGEGAPAPGTITRNGFVFAWRGGEPPTVCVRTVE